MATRRRFVRTSAGMLLLSGIVADLAVGCGSDGGGAAGSPTPTPLPTPTPTISNGIMTLAVADYPSLAQADGSATFNVPSAGAIIVAHLDAQTGATAYVCLTRVCTHQGCLVNYDAGTNGFRCPCHNSTYATNGTNTGGPAPAPLHAYATTFDGTTITVDLNS